MPYKNTKIDLIDSDSYSDDDDLNVLEVNNPITGQYKAQKKIKNNKNVFNNNKLQKLHKRIEFNVHKNHQENNDIKQEDSYDMYSCCYSPNDEYLAIGNGNGSISIFSSYNNQYDKCLYYLSDTNNLPTTCVKFRPYSSISDNKNVLLAGYSSGNLIYWHIQSQKKIYNIHEENNQILSIDCNEKYFATAGTQPIIRIYDEYTKKLLIELDKSHSSRIYSIKFDPNNSHIIYSGGWDNTIQIWDIRTGLSTKSIYGPHICGDSLSVHENKLLTGSYRPDNSIEIWDLRKISAHGTEPIYQTDFKAKFSSSKQMIYAASFSKDGKYFAAGGYDADKIGEIRLFNHLEQDVNKQVDYMNIGTKKSAIYSLVFNHSTTQLATVGGNQHIAKVLLV